jgi:hypothetical protein
MGHSATGAWRSGSAGPLTTPRRLTVGVLLTDRERSAIKLLARVDQAAVFLGGCGFAYHALRHPWLSLVGPFQQLLFLGTAASAMFFMIYLEDMLDTDALLREADARLDRLQAYFDELRGERDDLRSRVAEYEQRLRANS